MKRYLYFLKFFIEANPVRSITFLALIIFSVILLRIDSHIDNKYYIYASFKDGIDNVYVTKYLHGSGLGHFTFFIKRTDAIVENNTITVNEIREWYMGLLIIYGVMLLFLSIGLFMEEWGTDEVYRKFYKYQISRHKDTDFIYYVLRGKVIKKIPNDEEGRYSDKIESIGDGIDNYRCNKNLLDDFNGTLLEQREKSIKDVLD